MNPFVYPKQKHIRTQTPPVYKNYGSYKPYLRKEFSRKCIYCCTPDSMRGESSSGADHYRPQKYFPHLSVVYSNLFYCCNACNSRKSSHWPGHGKHPSFFIPNPCDHEMFRHLRFKGAVVEARTEDGAFACDLLDLNSQDVVEFRNAILVAIEATTARLNELGKLILSVKDRLSNGLLDQAKADEAIEKINVEIEKANRALLRLSGELAI